MLVAATTSSVQVVATMRSEADAGTTICTPVSALTSFAARRAGIDSLLLAATTTSLVGAAVICSLAVRASIKAGEERALTSARPSRTVRAAFEGAAFLKVPTVRAIISIGPGGPAPSAYGRPRDVMRYRNNNGQDWADVIDFLTMYPDARVSGGPSARRDRRFGESAMAAGTFAWSRFAPDAVGVRSTLAAPNATPCP
jgi:hypothetical protein